MNRVIPTPKKLPVQGFEPWLSWDPGKATGALCTVSFFLLRRLIPPRRPRNQHHRRAPQTILYLLDSYTKSVSIGPDADWKLRRKWQSWCDHWWKTTWIPFLGHIFMRVSRFLCLSSSKSVPPLHLIDTWRLYTWKTTHSIWFERKRKEGRTVSYVKHVYFIFVLDLFSQK